MDVSGDAGASGFADVHSEIDAVGVVELAQDGLHTLRELHHFAGSSERQFLQFVQMSIGDDHHVAGSIGISIQDDEAVLGAKNDKHFRVVPGFHSVTKDASDGFLGGGDVGVTPGGPEVIHSKGQGSRWKVRW